MFHFIACNRQYSPSERRRTVVYSIMPHVLVPFIVLAIVYVHCHAGKNVINCHTFKDFNFNVSAPQVINNKSENFMY